MKKRIEKLEEQQPEIGYKEQIIALCQQWYDAIWDEDTEAALQARKDVEPLLDEVPEWKEDYPKRAHRLGFTKVLYMHWGFFLRYRNPDVQELISTAVEQKQWPGSLARPEDFD